VRKYVEVSTLCIEYDGRIKLEELRYQAVLRQWIVTVMTLMAFAANSVLGRAALTPGPEGERWVDPLGFTVVRLLSGAALLAIFVGAARAKEGETRLHGSWLASFALVAYAVAFSWAYLTLSAGTGALILFGFVQATMYAWGIWKGERPGWGEWLGLAIALGGLVVLTAPGLETPPTTGAILMALAGVAWGIYSLLGRGQSRPVLVTAGNFVRAVPWVILLLPWVVAYGEFTPRGILLGVISGALTSGIGYVLWYAALKGLTATRAALVQLSVPVIAAVGGVAFLGESLSTRLVAATGLVLGGIGLAIARKN
jgi:drug/metabolite transporter (DMT)-like permease